ncbi:hypothetical protein [Pseudonocardia xishanensis]|uniref:Uncharacterized protein n=1 Tax=Pseudonocardia xishanensis TaxID=630995 RepID=A0ABP8RSF9_9PSEU
MACPKCGGTRSELLEPSWVKCTVIVDTKTEDWYREGEFVPVYCNQIYEINPDPAQADNPQCFCGEYQSLEVCADSSRPLCFKHLSRVEGRPLCAPCVNNRWVNPVPEEPTLPERFRPKPVPEHPLVTRLKAWDDATWKLRKAGALTFRTLAQSMVDAGYETETFTGKKRWIGSAPTSVVGWRVVTREMPVDGSAWDMGSWVILGTNGDLWQYRGPHLSEAEFGPQFDAKAFLEIVRAAYEKQLP